MSPASQREKAASVAERMRLARSLAGMTQEEAAHALGVTLRTYARWERAETQGFLGELPRIAEAFGTTTEELLDERPETSDVAAELAELRERFAALEAYLHEKLDPAKAAEDGIYIPQAARRKRKG